MTHASTSCPFSVTLKTSDKTTISCQQILRDLPGKRRVCRGSWQGRTVLIKLFIHPKSATRHWQREKQGIEALADNQLATPELLFAGTLDDDTPVLVFDFLHNAQTALDVWQQYSNDDERLHLLKQLTAAIAEQHSCGLWQQDLHLGNFLICDDSIYTIDGDAIRVSASGKTLPIKQRRENLALFLAQISPRYEFLFAELISHYATCPATPVDNAWSSILDNELPQARDKRRHTYIQKSYRNCSEFVRQRKPGHLAIYRRDANPELIQQLLSNPNALMANGTMLKDGNSATVVRIQAGGEAWVIKRYNIKSVCHALKRCWRPTRAWVSWGNAQRLSISDIDTPQAIAMIEKRFGPLRLGGYYVCKSIEAPCATDYFEAPLGDTKEITQQFVNLFKIFHKLGIYHGDCKATNFLVQDNHPCVIDLDAMREFRNRNRYLRAYKVDRERFLRNWRAMPELQRWFDERLP